MNLMIHITKHNDAWRWYIYDVASGDKLNLVIYGDSDSYDLASVAANDAYNDLAKKGGCHE